MVISQDICEAYSSQKKVKASSGAEEERTGSDCRFHSPGPEAQRPLIYLAPHKFGSAISTVPRPPARKRGAPGEFKSHQIWDLDRLSPAVPWDAA